MAKKKASSVTSETRDAYYAEMTKSKVAAGLSLEQATEVVARQRETDEANGVEIKVPEETKPPEPEGNQTPPQG